MVKFKELFSFSDKEIKKTLKEASLKDKVYGLKLLQAPIKEENQDFGKILIIASHKTGKAHDRNLVRRRIKEIFYKEKLYKKPINSILFVYKAALKLSFEQLKGFLIKSFQ